MGKGGVNWFYEEWAKAPRTIVHVTVDKGDDAWTGRVGLITQSRPAGRFWYTGCSPGCEVKIQAT